MQLRALIALSYFLAVSRPVKLQEEAPSIYHSEEPAAPNRIAIAGWQTHDIVLSVHLMCC